MISKEEFGRYIKDKDHLYKACLSNGYFLPLNRKNLFVTVKMLKEIYTTKCHCPKLSEINHRPCVNPPSSSVLRDECASIIENNDDYANEEQAKQWKRLAKYMRKNIPEKTWVLGLLALVAPGHPVFKKDYQPPRK
jgi:hypothetical protein